jgi:hypothetical protein
MHYTMEIGEVQGSVTVKCGLKVMKVWESAGYWGSKDEQEML